MAFNPLGGGDTSSDPNDFFRQALLQQMGGGPVLGSGTVGPVGFGGRETQQLSGGRGDPWALDPHAKMSIAARPMIAVQRFAAPEAVTVGGGTPPATGGSGGSGGVKNAVSQQGPVLSGFHSPEAPEASLMPPWSGATPNERWFQQPTSLTAAGAPLSQGSALGGLPAGAGVQNPAVWLAMLQQRFPGVSRATLMQMLASMGGQ